MNTDARFAILVWSPTWGAWTRWTTCDDEVRANTLARVARARWMEPVTLFDHETREVLWSSPDVARV